jgi:hypothetical protein
MEDLSLHSIQPSKNGLELSWTKEEGLSNLIQVEILNPESEVTSEFDYVNTYLNRHHHGEVSLAEVP